jgi:hypothetical protein
MNRNKNIYWKGYCHEVRNIAIYNIQQLINKHGYIVSYHMYSDMEISISIEIEERNIGSLYGNLKQYLDMSDNQEIESPAKTERLILFSITFANSTGDMSIESPHVPG